jgi:tetratricopeptide (TPR) repeat protein
MADEPQDKPYWDAMALLLSGMECAKKGDFEAAIERYTIAMTLTSKENYVFRVLRGDAHKAKGDHERALTDYNESIALTPEHVPAVAAYMARADLHERMGDRARAVADYRTALGLGPDMLPEFAKHCEDALKRLKTRH